MALNFPDSPIVNQVYTDTTSGFSFKWDGTVWQSFSPQSTKEILILDDISGSFNDSTVTFALTESGNPVYPVNAQQLRIVLGGVVQTPITDYTISQSDITFTTAPSSGLTFSGVSLGPAVPIGTVTISDGSVTPIKLSTGGPSWNTDGDVYISGIATITNALGSVKVGVGTTTLIVEGDARVTGILTVGTASVTIDGNTNTINVENIVGTAATFTGNVSIAGTLTYEDVTNVDSIGIITARSGIVLGPTANIVQLGTGTTISSPTSDTFTILTGGSERVRVSSAGVGIGTDNPSYPLDVNGAIRFGGTGNNEVIMRGWSASDTDIDGLIPGSTFGQIIEGPNNGHITIGIRDNDVGDSFSILSGGGNYQTNTTYDTVVAYFSAAGGLSVGTAVNPGAGAIYATGDITAFYSSDIRLKKDIKPISEPIKKLMEISGVTYKWNEEYLKDKDVDGYFVKETEVGVIAQDVEKVLPEVVATRENGYKAVRYEKLVALLIEAVKDQQHQINELKARLEEK